LTPLRVGPQNAYVRKYFGLLVLVVALLVGAASRPDRHEASADRLDARSTAISADRQAPPPDALLLVPGVTIVNGSTFKDCLRSSSRGAVQLTTHFSGRAVRALPRPDAVPHVRDLPLLI
jgi:hypothetical protein